MIQYFNLPIFVAYCFSSIIVIIHEIIKVIIKVRSYEMLTIEVIFGFVLYQNANNKRGGIGLIIEGWLDSSETK